MTEAWKQWEGQVVVGECHLRQYLCGGEHSAVFLTEHRGQKAAIKLISTDPENANIHLSRWELAAKLSHPHLIRLFQTGRCQLGDSPEMVYVVMEYAEEDLSQVVTQRAITPAEAREILAPTLEALAYVHGKGFVHGHMKPANVMAVDDRLIVSSDGLCRMGESSNGLWTPGVYDPPETAGGEISPAGDVWSIGMMLVEALTQRLPVWEETEHAEPVLPETLPASFVDFARHCLRRDPQERWTIEDITAWLHQTSRPPQGQTSAKPHQASVKWRYVMPAAALALALAVILVGPRLLSRRSGAPRAASVAIEQPKAQSRLDQKPMAPKTGQSTQASRDEKQASPGAGPVPTSVPSKTAARTASNGLVPGEVVHQVLPDVPRSARETIRGRIKVSVRARVDSSGRVVGAKLDSPGPSKYFAQLALQAARRWRFEPAKSDGQDVSSEWILRFEFLRTATRAVPVRVAR
jgi:TonB family protein